MMNRHVQFYVTDHRGVVEAMGSDSILQVDGRVRISTCHEWAREQAHELRHLQNYTHYQIRRGGINHWSAITDRIEL